MIKRLKEAVSTSVILCVAGNNVFVKYQRHSNMRYKKCIANMPAPVSGEYVSGCLLAVSINVSISMFIKPHYYFFLKRYVFVPLQTS